MGSDDDGPECCSCRTHAAVVEFASATYDGLARKAIFQMQRIEATGVYGDDYRHRTLWDEYCHEVQEGPHEFLEDSWDATVDPICHAIVETIPRQEAVLLTIGAVWDLNLNDDISDVLVAVAPDLIHKRLKRVIADMAGVRDMSRFDPTRS
jgi:hypothetical protein